jgi:hypothetical protein
LFDTLKHDLRESGIQVMNLETAVKHQKHSASTKAGKPQKEPDERRSGL